MTFYVENETDKELPFDIEEVAKIVIEEALDSENCPYEVIVDVTLTDNDGIHLMNKEFRDIDRPTDVLSFPLGENGNFDRNPETDAIMLGDIMISAEHAVAQADLYGHGFDREIAFLAVHSMLHLLGYDHVDGGIQRAIMREKEEKILDDLGLAINKV